MNVVVFAIVVVACLFSISTCMCMLKGKAMSRSRAYKIRLRKNVIFSYESHRRATKAKINLCIHQRIHFSRKQSMTVEVGPHPAQFDT